MRSAFAALTGLLTALLLSGCTTSTAGTASAGADGPATSAGAHGPATSTRHPARDNTYGAPRVTTPLDTTKYQAAPCSVITTAQAQALTLTPNTLATGVFAPPPHACEWNLPTDHYGITQGGVTAGFVLQPLDPGDPLGLTGIYLYYKRSGTVPTRLPDIDGQPAAIVVPTHKCDVWIGLTDNLAYHVQGEIDDMYSTLDACVSAKGYAVAAMNTMKSGA